MERCRDWADGGGSQAEISVPRVNSSHRLDILSLWQRIARSTLPRASQNWPGLVLQARYSVFGGAISLVSAGRFRTRIGFDQAANLAPTPTYRSIRHANTMTVAPNSYRFIRQARPNPRNHKHHDSRSNSAQAQKLQTPRRPLQLRIGSRFHQARPNSRNGTTPRRGPRVPVSWFRSFPSCPLPHLLALECLGLQVSS